MNNSSESTANPKTSSDEITHLIETGELKIAGLLNTASGDKQLRARVKLFGNLLGNVLLSQAGANVYAAVEKLRVGFIELHKKEDEMKRQRLMECIESLDENTLTQVVRAFSTYFSLVNVAEEASQLQQRRRQMRKGESLWIGSFDSALRDFIVNAVNGTPDYEYAMLKNPSENVSPEVSDEDFGSSNIFIPPSAGFYTFYVRDARGCIVEEIVEFKDIEIPNYYFSIVLWNFKFY